MMKVTTAIKEGFRITHSGWKLLLILFVIYLIFAPFNLESISPFLIETQQEKEPSLPWTSYIWFILAFLLHFFLQGGILAFVRDAIKEKLVKLDNFLRDCKSYFLRLLGLNISIFILSGLIFLVVVVIFTIVCVGGTILVKNFLIPKWIEMILIMVPIFLFVAVFSTLLFYFFILIAFPNVILVAKDGRIFRSILDSIKFVRNKFWKIAWLLTLISLIYLMFYLFLILLTFLLGTILNLNGGSFVEFITHFMKYGIPPKTLIIPYLILSCISQTYLGVLGAAAFMSYYLGNINEVAPEQIGTA